MGVRREGREHALQLLYQFDVAGGDVDEALELHWEREPDADPESRVFAERLVRAVETSREAIDELIEELSHRWKLRRMGSVELNLLRLAICELRTETDTPAAVIIDEAVEIAKDFGDRESHRFVHGLVEAARKRLRDPTPDAVAADGPTGEPTGDEPA